MVRRLIEENWFSNYKESVMLWTGDMIYINCSIFKSIDMKNDSDSLNYLESCDTRLYRGVNMAIRYDNLFNLLEDKNKTIEYLLEGGLSEGDLSRILTQEGTISTDLISKICSFLDCDDKDVINHVSDDK